MFISTIVQLAPCSRNEEHIDTKLYNDNYYSTPIIFPYLPFLFYIFKLVHMLNNGVQGKLAYEDEVNGYVMFVQLKCWCL